MEKFSKMLAAHDRGKLDDALTQEVAGLNVSLSKFLQAGKKAKGGLSLSLAFSVDENGLMTIVPTWSVKTPKSGVGAAVRYLRHDGVMSEFDPRQQQLPFPDGPAGVAASGEPVTGPVSAGPLSIMPGGKASNG